MTAISKLPRDPKPERIVVLPPSAFADDWESRPRVEVAVGLRRLSQQDLGIARREAEREAVGFYEELRDSPRKVNFEVLDELRNDALCIGAVGRAATDPNDTAIPYFLGQEDTAKAALTPEGARRLWDELVLLHVGGNVARPRASDEDCQRLGRALAQGLVKLDDEARMLAAYLIESLAVPEAVEDDESEDDDEGAIYVARSA